MLVSKETLSQCYFSFQNIGQIGRALVSTHDYRRAVEYYGKALRGQPTSVPLRHDLARLCIKLGRYNDAAGVLQDVSVLALLLKWYIHNFRGNVVGQVSPPAMGSRL